MKCEKDCVEYNTTNTRESREVIQALIQQGLSNSEIDENVKNILLGNG